TDFNAAMDKALHGVIGRRTDGQRDDGPEVLRKLLRIDLPWGGAGRGGPARPDVDRVVGQVDPEGAWTLDVTLTVPRRDERWQMRPVAKFDVRSGGRPSLAWATLEPLENCEIQENSLLVAPDVRSARFRGVTAVDSHPVAAAMAGVVVEIQQVREVSA
ncbi:transcriptional regulator, partial [Streptomyces diastaticus]